MFVDGAANIIPYGVSPVCLADMLFLFFPMADLFGVSFVPPSIFYAIDMAYIFCFVCRIKNDEIILKQQSKRRKPLFKVTFDCAESFGP